ncbi:YihY/virulence factor BrkB family protein [Parvularcula flava]|uniref:YihY/virulence factor BrkB family protein n=1 Tax=Aquisalinus luteolus TaxID=1566827 RepID=A0A8J3EPW7_9PROT|nr:YihY/virulence factor BrkB family protein [Aquisalinus luteolus]NHK26643.1 YihY/virulence factor BrkB family protein [Aquisalinus luteolus]GGH92967.1 hypothetical protein GCM10011355_03700 [Aquisalinus luteolus]
MITGATAGMITQIQDRLEKLPLYGLYQRVEKPVSRILASIGNDNIGLIAGGVAFYAFLSIFPAIAFALMIWGLFNSPDQLGNHLTLLSGIVPEDAFELIANQMIRIAEAQEGKLSWGAIASLALVLWSASRAVNALLSAMTVTINKDHKRGFFQQNMLALGFTIAGIFFALLSIAIISAFPPIIEALRLGAFTDALLHTFRWLMMFALFFGAVYSFYRIAHPRTAGGERIRPKRLWPGALLGALIWLMASIAFSFYLSRFEVYNETFGSLGAAIALMMWLWISAFAICIGAETNAEIQREASSN